MYRFLFRSFVVTAIAFSSIACTAAASAAVNWRTNLDAAKVEAAQTNRFVLLHFWSPTCGPCKQLDQTVFSLPQTGMAIERNYVPVKINADAWPAIVDAFRVTQVPTEVIVSPQGNVLSKPPTPRTPSEYVAQLDRLAAHFRQASQRQPVSAVNQPVNSAYEALPISAIGQTNAGAAATNQVGPMQSAVQGYPGAQNQSAPQGTTTPVHTGQVATANIPPHSTSVTPQVNSNPYAAGPAAAPSQTVQHQPSAPRYPAGPASSVPVAASTNGLTNNPYMTATSQPSPATNSNMPASPANNGVASRYSAVPAAASTQLNQQPTATNIVQAGATSTPQQAADLPSQQGLANPATITPTPVTTTLGLDGYCPVSLRFARKWIKGSEKIGVIHRGRTYLFAGEQERQQFMSDPDRYSPVFNGLDPVIMIDQRQAVEGSRRFGYEHRGAIYLFSSEETMKQFGSDPSTADAYATRVHEAMRRLDAAEATVRR